MTTTWNLVYELFFIVNCEGELLGDGNKVKQREMLIRMIQFSGIFVARGENGYATQMWTLVPNSRLTGMNY